jgi:hypothetical protein
MFDAIADANEVIAAENEARRAQIARCKPSTPGPPVAAERERLAQERAKLAELPPFRKLTGPATQQAIRRTLRAALNSAIAQQLITFNPASHVELASGRRPKPCAGRTSAYAAGGRPARYRGRSRSGRPSSSAPSSTPPGGNRLYALFHLVGFRGLRRGGVVGQDLSNVDLKAGLITPAKEIVVDGWDPYEAEPKTDGSANTIALDSLTIAALRAHKKRQKKDRKKRGTAWNDTARSSPAKTAPGSTPKPSPRPSAASPRRPTSRPSPSATSATSPRPSRTRAAATSTR